MKYLIKNGQPSSVNVTDKDFLAEGGEGKIYGKGNTIYKIYSDPKKMIHEAKIAELSVFTHPSIVNPLKVVMTEKNEPVGFTMNWVKDTVALCKLFTNDFRNRFGIDNDMIIHLIKSMAVDIDYIHSHRCLIVDGNEMNYLVDMKGFKTAYFIDVDSWQTPSFPATALMLSVRDFHSAQFSSLTDWFSFAVICTQLFVGIHPYKGTHPGFKKADMEGRMKANVSIFDKDVKLPSTARDLSCIPSAYQQWLKEVLQDGKRLHPPVDMGSVVAVTPRLYATITGMLFNLELIEEFDSEIVRYDEGFIRLANGACTYKTQARNTYLQRYAEPVVSPSGKVFFCYINGSDQVVFEPANSKDQQPACQLAGTDKMVYNNKVYVQSGEKLVAIILNEFGDRVLATNGNVWSIMPNSTKIFNGVVYQDVLGVPYFMVFYGERMCYQFQVDELKGFQILEAKQENGFMIVIAVKGNDYHSFWFKIDALNNKYMLFSAESTDYHVPNFITLPNGIVIVISPDDEVTVLNNKLDSASTKDMLDPAVTFDMKLCKHGMLVMGRIGKKLYKISMK